MVGTMSDSIYTSLTSTNQPLVTALSVDEAGSYRISYLAWAEVVILSSEKSFPSVDVSHARH